MTATIPISQQHGEDSGGPLSPVMPVITGDKLEGDRSGINSATSRKVNPVTPGYRGSSGRASNVGDEGTLDYENGLRIPEKFVFPRCQRELSKAEIEPVERFVATAISSQHEYSSSNVNNTTGGQVDVKDAAKALESYRALAESLRRPEDPTMLQKIFVALRTAVYQVACFADRHAQLIHLLFKFNPFDLPRILDDASDETKLPYLDYSLADSYMHLMVAIISANSVHVVPFMSAIWRTLTLGRSDIQEATMNRIHSLLIKIMQLCPKAMADLFPIMSNNYPYWTKPGKELDFYYRQCFVVLEYLPSIRRQVLELIIDKSLEIDVNIKIQDGGNVMVDDENEESEEAGVFEMDGVEELESTEKKRVTKEDISVDELSDKLDYILCQLFRYIRSKGHDCSSARVLYRELMPMFESSILTTYKAKFVQYCIFLLCGLEAETITNMQDATTALSTDGASQNTPTTPYESNNLQAFLDRSFAAKLIEIFVDPYRAMLTRRSGACYLASFISRATYVSPLTVCESISALLRWAEAYMYSLDANSIRAADAREQGELHSLFYTVCQAAFYVMCFRGVEAIKFYQSAVEYHSPTSSSTPPPPEDEDLWEFPHPDTIDIGGTRWAKICCHELQPLSFCLESVRDEFLHVAHAFDMIESETLGRLVKESKRMSTGRRKRKTASTISTAATLENQRQSGGVGGLGVGSNPLKTFFPFDPLLLRRSHSFIEPFYKNWNGPIEEEDSDDDDDDEENDDMMQDGQEPTIDAAEDESEGQNSIGNDSGDSSDDDSTSDGETGRNFSYAQPMSLASSYGIDMPLASSVATTEELRDAWQEAVERPRSYSIENGSW